jgi:hypothetical protein
MANSQTGVLRVVTGHFAHIPLRWGRRTRTKLDGGVDCRCRLPRVRINCLRYRNAFNCPQQWIEEQYDLGLHIEDIDDF